jgi:sulfite reductase (NADPH) flavoprotein alpha-component
MFSEEQLQKVNDFISSFTKEEQLWLSGYLAGINNGQTAQAAGSNGAIISAKVTIAYGTETGNSKKIASQFAARAKQRKINAKVVSLEQYKLSELEKEEYFFTIVSTHGDGEPPAAAKKFYEHIHSFDKNLPKLKYSVLALGDTAYPLFCKTGEDVDAQLEKLGAKKIADRRNCDVDYEAEANEWIEDVLQKLLAVPQAATAAFASDRKKPNGRVLYKGKISANVNLNDVGSSKQTHHIEIIPESAAHYAPGDSIGIVPVNSDEDLQPVLHELKTIGSEFVTYKSKQYTFYYLLKNILNIRQLQQRILDKYAALEEIPVQIKGQYDLGELLSAFPAKITNRNWQALVDILEPIAPRLYSVASSNAAHNEEVHLTVARSSFQKNGATQYGLASNYLSQLPLGTEVQFYVQKNNLFHLPADDKDIIMIGPGTGIAPFRAFVAERDARGAEGRNWLFFGDQHFKTDFLYQTEWQNYLETGALNRLDVAFSRDTESKVYVQHKLLKHAAEVFNWLQSGAYFYVCGSKKPMSVDVENILLQIIAEQSCNGNEFALEYLNILKEEGRYLKDVY